jgi:hypothetical protein
VLRRGAVDGWYLRGVGPWTGMRRLRSDGEESERFAHLDRLVAGGILAGLGALVLLVGSRSERTEQRNALERVQGSARSYSDERPAGVYSSAEAGVKVEVEARSQAGVTGSSNAARRV